MTTRPSLRRVERNFTVTHRGRGQAPSLEVEEEVRTAWNSAMSASPKQLVDGEILSAISMSPAGIDTVTVHYRYFMAQRSQPHLFPLLQVRPLAVSGLLLCEGKLVFGTRSDDMTQSPGGIELVPSGGVDSSRVGGDGRVDIVGQLLEELREEIGLEASEVTDTVLIGVVEEPAEHVLDVAIAIATARDQRDLIAMHKRLGSAEYRELFFIEIPQLRRQVAEWGDRLVPASKAIVEWVTSEEAARYLRDIRQSGRNAGEAR